MQGVDATPALRADPHPLAAVRRATQMPRRRRIEKFASKTKWNTLSDPPQRPQSQTRRKARPRSPARNASSARPNLQLCEVALQSCKPVLTGHRHGNTKVASTPTSGPRHNTVSYGVSQMIVPRLRYGSAGSATGAILPSAAATRVEDRAKRLFPLGCPARAQTLPLSGGHRLTWFSHPAAGSHPAFVRK